MDDYGYLVKQNNSGLYEVTPGFRLVYVNTTLWYAKFHSRIFTHGIASIVDLNYFMGAQFYRYYLDKDYTIRKEHTPYDEDFVKVKAKEIIHGVAGKEIVISELSLRKSPGAIATIIASNAENMVRSLDKFFGKHVLIQIVNDRNNNALPDRPGSVDIPWNMGFDSDEEAAKKSVSFNQIMFAVNMLMDDIHVADIKNITILMHPMICNMFMMLPERINASITGVKGGMYAEVPNPNVEIKYIDGLGLRLPVSLTFGKEIWSNLDDGLIEERDGHLYVKTFVYPKSNILQCLDRGLMKDNGVYEDFRLWREPKTNDVHIVSEFTIGSGCLDLERCVIVEHRIPDNLRGMFIKDVDMTGVAMKLWDENGMPPAPVAGAPQFTSPDIVLNGNGDMRKTVGLNNIEIAPGNTSK